MSDLNRQIIKRTKEKIGNYYWRCRRLGYRRRGKESRSYYTLSETKRKVNRDSISLFWSLTFHKSIQSLDDFLRYTLLIRLPLIKRITSDFSWTFYHLCLYFIVTGVLTCKNDFLIHVDIETGNTNSYFNSNYKRRLRTKD